MERLLMAPFVRAEWQSRRLWKDSLELRTHSQQLFEDTRSLRADSKQLRLHAAMLKEQIQRALGKLRFAPSFRFN